jgi:hypothetical protein
MPQFGMADAGRLMDAGAGLQQHVADTFVVELDPTLQHIHQLEGDVVMMPFAERRRPRNRADHVSDDRAVGRIENPQVPIFEERPETSSLECRVACVAD